MANNTDAIIDGVVDAVVGEDKVGENVQALIDTVEQALAFISAEIDLEKAAVAAGGAAVVVGVLLPIVLAYIVHQSDRRAKAAAHENYRQQLKAIFSDLEASGDMARAGYEYRMFADIAMSDLQINLLELDGVFAEKVHRVIDRVENFIDRVLPF